VFGREGFASKRIFYFSAVAVALPALIASTSHGQMGACCMVNGSCVGLTFYECILIEQAVQWMEGEDCDPNPCLIPPGACCFNTGQCVVLAEEDCVGGPGVYAWMQGLSCVLSARRTCDRLGDDRVSAGYVRVGGVGERSIDLYVATLLVPGGEVPFFLHSFEGGFIAF